MSEPLAPGPLAPGPPASSPPDLMQNAVGPSPELSRRNMRFSAILCVIFLVLFGGTFGIGIAYLWLA
ncbi:MAG TPA: hypothetical protein VMV08_09260 [Gaiellaceae bacterium]|nr:hypothetical protein [Gaiellaceae bacterium]